MKFHGITMVGPFVAQKVSSLPGTNTAGRIVYHEGENNVYYNDGSQGIEFRNSDTYKGNDIDTNGDGIVNGADDADTVDGLDADSFLRKDASSYPDQDATYSIGDGSRRFNNIYAVNFMGTANQARYADLAERYTCKNSPEVGDVILISENEDFDCEVSDEVASPRVLGVVSENPAYMMNSEEEGPVVARVGKVKCKVKGPVKKGMPLVSGELGNAIAVGDMQVSQFSLLGRANESINSNEEKLIEIIM